MNVFGLIAKSAVYFRRTNAGVAAGALLGTAILVGALAVGDSVRGTLRSIALSRLGETRLALHTPDRLFRPKLAEELTNELQRPVVPVLALSGSVSAPDGSARANGVQVLGVNERFWSLSQSNARPSLQSGQLLFSERLGRQVPLNEGAPAVLRVENPTALPKDAAFSVEDNASAALRAEFSGVAKDEQMGRFDLNANQLAPYNAFVTMEWLAKEMDVPEKANMLLIGGEGEQSLDPMRVQKALKESLKIEDLGIKLKKIEEHGVWEIRTDRVFIDPPMEKATLVAYPDAEQMLTYFVNTIRVRDRATPYSMISAVSDPPVQLKDDEILINQWLADDLAAEKGDLVELEYFVLGRNRQLETRVSEMWVRDILPMEGWGADPSLMPPLPGLSEAENCRDWEPGFPVDLERIRPKDETYWDRYKGAPKAIMKLETGIELWGNPYGELTSIRFPLDKGSHEEIERAIIEEVDPEAIGMFFREVRRRALAASTESLDFGQLFLGFSFFLIVASLLLMALLFMFSVEQRSNQIGMFLALGFKPARVKRLFLAEGIMLAAIGSIIGVFLGLLYTHGILFGLSTVWLGAGGSSPIEYHLSAKTPFIGAFAGIVLSSIVILLTIRNLTKHPVRVLLSRGLLAHQQSQRLRTGFGRPGFLTALICLIAGIGLAVFGGTKEGTTAAALFFLSGALLLVSGLLLFHWILGMLAVRKPAGLPSLTALGLRAATRRRTRSVATAALLACGCFLIVAVAANRKDPGAESDKRSSGTGGFTFWGRSAVPISADFSSREELEDRGLSAAEAKRVEFVPMRMFQGDDASCRNLNRAQLPTLYGVDPNKLKKRNAFSFKKTMKGIDREAGWEMLAHTERLPESSIPAVGDEATIVWALGKSVGDSIQYTDDRGNSFDVVIVGMLENSIFQGGLVVSQDDFLNKFPYSQGYAAFLVDVNDGQIEQLREKLTRAFQNRGLELDPAARRLRQFAEVENTYLSIFEALGGLGLLLGSVGLGIVVLRNIMERRNELGLLKAVGFNNTSLKWLVLSEHWFLLLAGLLCGTGSAVVAVLPLIYSPTSPVPVASIGLTLLIVLLSGMLWCWLAARWALRGDILDALRNE